MATAQGQDVICCQVCSNPVEHHCNLCHVDLCLSCIPKHMADKSRRHEVVEYTFRKEHTVILPSCLAHEKYQCETYCKDCRIPICLQCLMGSHKKHEFTNINEILQEHEQKIISDTEELENTIVAKYRNINQSTTAEFDKVLSAIKEQEDKICQAVHRKSTQLTEEVSNQKKEYIRKNKESRSLVETAEKEVNQIVKENKDILKGNDATSILNYQSRNEDFRKGPELPSFSCPKLLPGNIKENQIAEMFGFLQTRDGHWNIYIYTRNAVNVLLSTPNWFPVGLHYIENGDLLVSMRSTNKIKSRVVRYFGTIEKLKIQYDSQGQPLFSTGSTAVLLLTENGNGDICVADNSDKTVVAVDSSGGLRFKYKGNLSKQTKYRDFIPLNIATDVNTQILIDDNSNNIVHIIDCDGNFVRYIEHPCNGGLSIDTEHKLVIGDRDSGKVQIIKYLE
ncbi:E3 ubiquitin-protein ligase TRIM71-like [Saccostrea cucullata]|uniref:E3 ubiquitin-protein ligase TRIM71-like n=1 Tax=Saccostrea cuccullata TaxID=36930 RepID=UPI002ED14E18